MWKEISFIELILENCEVITIQREAIGHFILDDLKTSIRRIASNSISEFKSAGVFALEIYKKGNDDYFPFGLDKENTKVFTRLQQFRDITSVEVHFENDTSDQYFVEYDTASETSTNNLYEETYLSKLGNLYIVISKDKDLEDFFDKSEIDERDTSSWFS